MMPAARDETGESSPMLTRLGMRISAACERYFADAFVFALAAVLVVLSGRLLLGEAPLKLVSDFGHGFWVLVPFTMQMALVILAFLALGLLLHGRPRLRRARKLLPLIVSLELSASLHLV